MKLSPIESVEGVRGMSGVSTAQKRRGDQHFKSAWSARACRLAVSDGHATGAIVNCVYDTVMRGGYDFKSLIFLPPTVRFAARYSIPLYDTPPRN